LEAIKISISKLETLLPKKLSDKERVLLEYICVQYEDKTNTAIAEILGSKNNNFNGLFTSLAAKLATRNFTTLQCRIQGNSYTIQP
jgi:DNA-binding CsgD family transcriptional regulator